MKCEFIAERITYDGSQLSSHWPLQTCGLMGNSIVTFIGPADVKGDSLVDLVDQIEERPIYSSSMLHFIGEFFDIDLKTGILYQRLLIVIIGEYIREQLLNKESHLVIVRQNDDLYIKNKDLKKLTVAITTSSPVSVMFHTGINIRSDGIPVPAFGLDDLEIDAKPLLSSATKTFIEEIRSINEGRVKVRPIG